MFRKEIKTREARNRRETNKAAGLPSSSSVNSNWSLPNLNEEALTSLVRRVYTAMSEEVPHERSQLDRSRNSPCTSVNEELFARFQFPRRVPTTLSTERPTCSSRRTSLESFCKSWSKRALLLPCVKRLDIKLRVCKNSPSRDSKLCARFGSYSQFNP